MNRNYKTALILGGMLIFPTPVFAYLDPGTGSLFLQIILGGVAGLAVAFNMYWHKFTSLFRFGKRDATDEPGSDNTKDA